MKTTIGSSSSKICFFTLIFLILNATIAFTVNPTTVAAQSNSCPSSDSSSSLSSSSSSSQDSPSTTTSKATMASKIPLWFQHEISITAPSRGCHLVTGDVQKAISKDISQIKIGMCNLFIQHTSASLTINENADPDVRRCVTFVVSFGRQYYCFGQLEFVQQLTFFFFFLKIIRMQRHGSCLEQNWYGGHFFTTRRGFQNLQIFHRLNFV